MIGVVQSGGTGGNGVPLYGKDGPLCYTPMMRTTGVIFIGLAKPPRK